MLARVRQIDIFAKMVQWIGRRVEVTGTSSRDAFSARYIDIAKISATK